MEFMENYSPLSSYINTFLETTSINKSLYTLDKLHALGFMHNDFHDDNVLLVENYNYFGFEKDTSNGRSIIIDFGRTNQIKHPTIIDDIYRLKLLKKESYYAHHGLFFIFKWLDEQHKLVQDKYIAIFEKYYKCDIYKIINSYNFYIGGTMAIPNSKFDNIIHKHIYNYNNNNNKNNKDTNINTNSLADQAEAELKLTNPEKYNELIDSIKDTLKEEKHKPGYIKKLFMNQMNGLIDPAFILPVDDNPNKLTLMME